VIYRTEAEGCEAIRAFDPKTGVRKWEFKMTDVTGSGVLTAASNLLFTGGREGYFWALDARTGAELWRANTGGDVASGPITYSVNGRQYVSVSAGNSLFTLALRRNQ
jgi:alcohol dehydrogenase (cytochrome c)